MSVPALTSYTPGIGVYLADWANTVVQGGALLADLRTFPGLSNMTVWMIGTTTPSDGGQGMFVWNASATAPDDDGVTTIAPSGVSTGRWLRQSTTTTECYNVSLFGFVGDGVTDNTAAWNVLVTTIEALSNGAIICFPTGIYRFDSQISFTYPTGRSFGLTILGSGPDATTLYWPNSGGMVLTMTQNAHTIQMRDFTITCASAGAYIGVLINGPGLTTNIQSCNDFVRISGRGADTTFLSNYWATIFDIRDLNNSNFIACTFNGKSNGSGSASGNGVSISGTTAPASSIVQNFTDCWFAYLGGGIIYGTKIQGLSVSQCNFSNSDNGIIQTAAAAGGAQLAVVDSQFACYSTAIAVLGDLYNLISIGNLFIFQTDNAQGIGVGGAANLNLGNISGNQFGATGGTSGAVGVDIGPASGTATAVNITGNVFLNLLVGIILGATTSTCNVQSNTYKTCTGTVTDAGAGNTIGGGST